MDYIYDNGRVAKTNLSINGVPFPPPAPGSFEISKMQVVVNSGRTAAAIAVATLVRPNVYKITPCKWNFLTVNEIKRMEDAMGQKMWMDVQFLDNNEWVNIKAYRGDIRKIPHMILETGLYDGYVSITMPIIQQ